MRNCFLSKLQLRWLWSYKFTKKSERNNALHLQARM